MSKVRLRRLQADYEQLADYARRHPRINLVQVEGKPPEKYHIEYRIASLRQDDDNLRTADTHLVQIMLPASYPRSSPQCRMLTPVFHPNIAPHAICIGDHWNAGEPLWAMAARIGEMLAYQSYNIKSPLNGEAARWVEQNANQVPTDTVSLLPDESIPPAAPTLPAQPARPASPARPAAPAKPASPARPAAPVRPASSFDAPPLPAAPALPAKPTAQVDNSTVALACPGCGARYRVPKTASGKRTTCKQCSTLFQIPTID
jgi:ubiquitin-protein ligase